MCKFPSQGKLFSDSESIQARAEAAVLLKQLDFPVGTATFRLEYLACCVKVTMELKNYIAIFAAVYSYGNPVFGRIWIQPGGYRTQYLLRAYCE